MTDELLRSKLSAMNGLVFDEAVESGSSAGADLVFLCGDTGLPLIEREVLTTPSATANFSTIVNELQALGYQNPNEKYVIWYDDGGAFAQNSGFCGQGSIQVDQAASAENANNSGPSWNITYDDDYYECGFETMMHEVGHNLGAVQHGAPYSTGAFHCFQGEVYVTDVMCYNDGGPTDPGEITPCGSSYHFDCDHNDYFDAKIGAGAGAGTGSYLDLKWNLGACYVRWIVNHGCAGLERVTTNPALASQILINGTMRDSWGLDWLKPAPGNYTLPSPTSRATPSRRHNK